MVSLLSSSLLLACVAILFLGGVSIPSAHARLIFRQDCDGVTPSEEVMDANVEERFRRYIEKDAFPRSFASEEHVQRWCFLWTADQALRAERLEHRVKLQYRSLDERFYKQEEETVIDVSTDKTLNNLSVIRQNRVLARVRNQNCGQGGSTEQEMEEYAICLALIKEHYAQSEQAAVNRRITAQPLLAPRRVQERAEGQRFPSSRTRAPTATQLRQKNEAFLRSSTMDIRSVLQKRTLQGGLRPVPRTLQEVMERYKDPMTIEGDR
jgi:hypothetical protein